MQQEMKYGKALASYTAPAQKTTRKKSIFLICAVILIIATIALLIIAEDEYDVMIAYALVAGLCAIPFIIKFFITKAAEAVIYESGFTLVRGSKITEAAFNDIAGMQRSSESTTLIATGFGFIGALIIGALSSLIPGLKSYTINITKRDGSIIILSKSMVPNFKQFSVDLDIMFADWLLWGLTLSNIHEANIAFGKDFSLSGGQFIFKKSKKEGVVAVPWNYISGVEEGNDGWYWLTGTELDKKGNPIKLACAEYNSTALLRIGQMITDYRRQYQAY